MLKKKYEVCLTSLKACLNVYYGSGFNTDLSILTNLYIFVWAVPHV